MNSTMCVSGDMSKEAQNLTQSKIQCVSHTLTHAEIKKHACRNACVCACIRVRMRPPVCVCDVTFEFVRPFLTSDWRSEFGIGNFNVVD